MCEERTKMRNGETRKKGGGGSYAKKDSVRTIETSNGEQVTNITVGNRGYSPPVDQKPISFGQLLQKEKPF